MKKFTVITKDGSKWLLSWGSVPKGVKELDTTFSGNRFVYLGSHPEGTVLSEEQVSVIYQVSVNGVWAETTYENYAEDDELGFPVRTAYTDAESYDRHINDNPRYLLFSHMSSEHGLTLLDSELDEIARHAAPMTGVEYWKERCKVAEQMIGICPSDPKTYDEFCRLYDEWEQLIEQNQWPR